MKKKKKSLQYQGGPVKLYLEEIFDIIDTAREIGGDGKLTVDVGDYEIFSTEEFSEFKQKEYCELGILYKTSSPTATISVSVDINKFTVLCNEDNLVHQGAFSKIEKILKSHRRWWGWINSLPIYVSVAATMGSVLMMTGKIYDELYSTFFGFIMVVVSFVIFALYLATSQVRKSKIILVSKSDYSSFWKRNQDTIVVALITAIISIIGTLLVQAISK